MTRQRKGDSPFMANRFIGSLTALRSWPTAAWAIVSSAAPHVRIPEANLRAPETVVKLDRPHPGGADVIETNTFGAN